MKDLCIVIVSWNVLGLLERCLDSLESACRGLTWEVVIVDNASSDRTAECLKDFSSHRSNFKLITNPTNRGFAAACNQGIAAGADARYVLLLNPDTECLPDALALLVAAGDANPEAGILGPSLEHSDGVHQESIRRFPRLIDQVAIMLKLHHVFPGLIRRYLCGDLDPSKEQNVDQVMGSCFLIRRELIEDIGGLDERYFIWFEEVDYCKAASRRGWNVRYVPTILVTHHGGASFGQVFSLKKQRYFNTSLLKYFHKWHSGLAAGFLWALQPFSVACAWVSGLLRIQPSAYTHSTPSGAAWIPWTLAIIGLEVVSAVTIFHNSWNAIATIAVGIVVGCIAYKRPTLGLAILVAELLIGSKGQLLQLWGWPGDWSLRIVMFATFLVGWFGNAIETGSLKKIPELLLERFEWILLFVIVFFAFIRGLVLGNEFVLADANSWGFLLLLPPVLDLAARSRVGLKRDMLPVLIVAPLWLAVKTIGLEYLFSHGFPSISPEAYLWVRRTGVGEVTLIIGNAFRIFMQSYIYFIPALLFPISYLLQYKKKHRLADWMLIATFAVLGISLSRSIWIGCAVGIISLAFCYRKTIRHAWKMVFRLALLGFSSLVILFATIAFPIPPVDVASLADLFASRASTNDAASASRWALFPVILNKIKEAPVLGYGFGATVTYITSDPRILATNPSGEYTTYAFEWGWLEHWVKFGMLGFILMIALVYRIVCRLLQSNIESWIKYGAIASLLGVAAVHIFSPYFNHPLGFAILFAAEGLVITSRDIYRSPFHSS